MCGDCCELTEGGATTFALCLGCVKRGGSSLVGPWLSLLMWLGVIVLGLAGVGVLLLVVGYFAPAPPREDARAQPVSQ